MALILSVGQWAYGATGTTAICKWKDNKKAAWTRSIDDNVAGQVDWVMSVVNPRGIKVTWFIMTGIIDAGTNLYFGDWPMWQGYAAAYDFGPGGHEIGAHSVDHPCNNPCVYPADYIRAQLADNKARIEQQLPSNGKCLTIAYPCYCDGSDTMRRMARDYFIAGRGTTGDACCYQGTASPSDMYALFVGSESSGAVDEIIAAGGWRNSYSHAIDDQPAFVTFCDYLYSKRDVLWTGAERDVAQYILERNAAAVQVVSASSSQIVLNLTHALDTAVCNFTFPLTLKTEVPAAWDSVTVTQSGSAKNVKAVTETATKYACFNARPNQGQITLTAKGTTAVTDEPIALPVVARRYAAPTACPSPVRAEWLSQYLRADRDLVLHDLSGKPATADGLPLRGIYILQNIRTKASRIIAVLE
jgi:hypothetical protein